MTFFQLAMRYLSRKKGKTILLFLVFVLIGSMILGTSMLLRTAENSKKAIQEKMDVEVIAEVSNLKDSITQRDIQQISLLDGVTFINRTAHHSAVLPGLFPFTEIESLEEDNAKFVFFTYDDLQHDSAFSEQRYRLLAGEAITPDTEQAAVINSLLAELNGLQVGSTLQLTASDGTLVPVRIIGLFFSGNERRQSDTTLSANRIENQIFVDSGTYVKLFPNDGYEKIAVYAGNPEMLDTLVGNLQSIFPDTVKLTTSDALFERTKAPLEQILHISRLMLILTFVTGTVVLTVLLCMWMRTRKKEMAILISIGKQKTSILLQVLLEAYTVFLTSVLVSCGSGFLMAWILKKTLFETQAAETGFELFLKVEDIATLFVMGSIIVLAAVLTSIFPVLQANPKDTLSKMEG